MKYPEVFAYGPSVQNGFVYRGYKDMLSESVNKLLGYVPNESGIYEFKTTTKDMSWSFDIDVALTVAEPWHEGMWYAVAKTSTSNGQWLAPGKQFKNVVVSSGVESKGDASVMASEVLQITPGKPKSKIAIVYYEYGLEFDEIAALLSDLAYSL